MRVTNTTHKLKQSKREHHENYTWTETTNVARKHRETEPTSPDYEKKKIFNLKTVAFTWGPTRNPPKKKQ